MQLTVGRLANDKMSMEAGPAIPEKIFFRIGEVCDLIKVQPHVLRYWETEFPMLTPQKNRAGQRVYRRKDVEMVMRIRNLLYEEKFTIAGAKKKLMDEQHRPGLRPKTPVEASQSKEPVGPTPPIEVKEPAPAVERTLPDEPEDSLFALTGDSSQFDSPEESASKDQHFLDPKSRTALRDLRRNLEDLLTLLNSDASIKR